MKMTEKEFLMNLLSIPSVNGENSEKDIAVYIQQFMVESGIDAQIQFIDEKHANVVAKLQGKSSEIIIWNGHMDTVPYGDEQLWDTNPRTPIEKEGKIFARGASDMKSGLAGMIWTLCKMKEENYVPEKTIVFYGTCDEEKNGVGARYLLENGMQKNAQLMLIGEPTGLKLGMAQKGCIWLQLHVHGKTSHGAYPEQGINAVEYGFLICREIKRRICKHEHNLLGKATAQITMLQGGIVPNMTPDKATFLMDIRTVPGMSTEQIIVIAEEECQKYENETENILKVEIELKNDRFPIEISEDNEWVKKMNNNSFIGIIFFTDASILIRDTPEMPVLLYGPGEPDVAHKPNEYVELKNYMEYISCLRKIF